MKLIIKIFFLLYMSLSVSQTIEGRVLDSISQEPIEYANITLLTRNKGVYTNKKGEYHFDVSKHLYDTLKVSSIGYVSKNIALNRYKDLRKVKLDINLTEKITELDEVVIEYKKKKYKRKYTLGEEKDGNAGVSSLIGYETCVLIDNPFDLEGKLKNIYIKLIKRKNAQFTASLNIKFYSYDSKNKRPGYELYKENLIINPKNKKYTLNIKVEDLDIFIPKEGMCVGVEFIDLNNESKKYDIIGPMYRFTYSTEENLTWSKYRGKDWKTGIVKFDYKNDNRTGNVMIGANVLFPKK